MSLTRLGVRMAMEAVAVVLICLRNIDLNVNGLRVVLARLHNEFAIAGLPWLCVTFARLLIPAKHSNVDDT